MWGIGSRRVAKNLLPDFDRCPKEVLVVSKVPWVYTESDDVVKAWERGYVTVSDFRWATNTGSLVRDLNSCHKIAKNCCDLARSSVHIIIINLDCEADPCDVHSCALTVLVTACNGTSLGHLSSLAKCFPGFKKYSATDSSTASSYDVNCTFYVG